MDKVNFPKTFSITDIFNQADHEIKDISMNAKFDINGIFNFNHTESNMIKEIKITIKNKSAINYIKLLINDCIVEKSKADEENRNQFNFTIFDTNGIINNPHLFDLRFVCFPKPLNEIDIEIKFRSIIFDDITFDFLKYNQYYSIHYLRIQTEHKEDKKMILAIYYCPMKKPNYNTKFIKTENLEEFIEVINLPYEWECPTIHGKPNYKKNNNYRMISVECNSKIEQKINEDKIFNCETSSTKLSNDLINKSFIVHKDISKDIEAHLLSEYALIPYTTIYKLPTSGIDYDKMKDIKDNQVILLTKFKY